MIFWHPQNIEKINDSWIWLQFHLQLEEYSNHFRRLQHTVLFYMFNNHTYIYLICVACLSTLWLSPNMCIFACSCFCHPQIALFATKGQTPLNGQLRQGSYSGTKRNHAFERCSHNGISPFRWWLEVDTMEATPAALKPFAIRSSTAPPAKSFNIDLSLVDDIGADLGGSFLVSCTENSRILCLRWNKYENDRFEVPLSLGFVKACKHKARPKLKGSSRIL